MPGTVTFSNPNFPGNGKRGSVEMGKRQSHSTGTSGLLKSGGVVKLDDISQEGVKAGKPQRSYSHAIASAHRTIVHMEEKNHESTRNMMKLFLGIVLAAGLLATFGVIFYVSTTDGSKVHGTTWRTSNDDPVAVSSAVTRVSMDDEFGALVDESRRRRRRLEEGDVEESSLTDSAQCVSLRATTDKMKRIFVSGEGGESFSCKIGSTMVNCESVTAAFTCETGEKVAYSPDGERRLGVVAHPEGETEHSLITNEDHHVHGRTLWFWKFLAALFGIEEVEAEVEEEFESRPNKAVDCQTTSWTSYGQCSYNYDGNGNWMNRNFGSTRCVQIKSRTVSTHAAHGGRSCGDLSQTRTCSCPSSIDDKITYGEECDDGNSVNGDGCSSTQTIEEGFLCSPSAPTSSSYFVNSKSSCHGLWNNGVLEFGEDCDDGNENPNDGCHNGVRDTNYICDHENFPGQACTKARIRRDWNQLDDTEKELYVSAINDLKKSGIYDDFVHVHGLTNNKEYAHGTGGFLPWHRWYLFQFEEALRNQDDKYKDDPNTSDEDLNIGCVGAGKHGFEGFWVVPKLPTHPDKTCLSRSRSLESDGTEGFTSAADMIETIMQFDTYGAYGGFRAKLEGLPHANPHNLLGGHIRTFVSPADPLFFSHHTYVDKLWAMWQDCHNHEDVDKAAISGSGDDYYMHVFDKNSENVMDETQAKNLGLYDGVDGALPFFAIDPNSAAPSGACIEHTATPNNAAGSPTAHSCTECVAYYDDWCNSEWTAALPGQWDSTCVAICSNQCTAYCGTPPTVIHASQFNLLKENGLFPDSAEGAQGSSVITPRSMHNIKDPLLRYSYEPDEFDKKILQSRLGTCDMGHYMWHYEGLSADSRRLKFEEMSERRKLSESATEGLDLIYDNLEKTLTAAMNDSDFIDDRNIDLDGLQAIREKECKLLYKKYPITGKMTPDEVFWRRWGKRKDFNAGVLKGKCEEFLNK
ncbi:hypothetical protein TrRE_jg4311 [Triparma retinervis]|uniref:Tyrosinase copper-binding domain-containing protein n=1 Tax=Triparma retinervis TaxID=2557542 RepID=A0A9W7G1T1_9STRA|nr:hypothetical protein TrRE_jg4311 [Triparma retinervis]